MQISNTAISTPISLFNNKYLVGTVSGEIFIVETDLY